MPQKDSGSEVEKFFQELPTEDKKEVDIFDDKKSAAPTDKVETAVVEEDDEPRKNRRHRRLEQALQAERESNIALNERVRALAEIREIERNSVRGNDDLDPRLTRVFGETPEGKEIARTFGEILAEETTRAKEEALAEIEQRQLQGQEEQKGFETFIDSQLENLEDQFNVDLTSDAPKARKARREFLEMVQNLSPKDEEGMITGYADFGSTFDIYQKTQTERSDASRNKEMASRSMQRSGNNSSSNSTQITPGFRGWEKDYNINS